MCMIASLSIPGQGTDRANFLISMTTILSDFVENLTLKSNAIRGYGNAQANEIIGNRYDNYGPGTRWI